MMDSAPVDFGGSLGWAGGQLFVLSEQPSEQIVCRLHCSFSNESSEDVSYVLSLAETNKSE